MPYKDKQKRVKKTDAIISFIIGFFIGLFFFIFLKTTDFKVPYSWGLMIVFPPLSVLGMLIVSLLGKRFLFIYQMGKFVLVGALNTMIDFGVLNLLMLIFKIYAGAFYSVFVGISFIVASVNSYFWNKHWTFVQRKEVFHSKEYLKLLIILTGGLFLHVVIASFVVNIIGPQFGMTSELWANVGKFVAVLIAWIWNFLGAKFIVFKK